MITKSKRVKNIKVRKILITSLLLVALLFLLYKYFEWLTLSNISAAYSTAYFNEIKLVSENEPLGNDFTQSLINNKQFNNAKNLPDYLTAWDDLNGKLNTVLNTEQGYLDLITKDQGQFQSLKKSSFLLLGERGTLSRRIVNDQLSYYSDEIKRENSGLAILYGFQILMTTGKDNAQLNDFLKNVGSSTNPAVVGKYFGEIASLEKYTDSNFKFDKEDYVGTYYPNFITKVNNFKKYLSAYYLAEKNFTAGNTDAGILELRGVGDLSSSSYFDYASIFSEQTSTDSDLQKDTLSLVSDQAAAIKEFKSKQLYRYPFLKDISFWREDFVLCQMYDFKTGIFHSITSKYPVSKNVSDLIKELSSINPKTDNVDNTFDQTVMTFSNTEKSLNYTCTDKYTGEKVSFTTVK